MRDLLDKDKIFQMFSAELREHATSALVFARSTIASNRDGSLLLALRTVESIFTEACSEADGNDLQISKGQIAAHVDAVTRDTMSLLPAVFPESPLLDASKPAIRLALLRDTIQSPRFSWMDLQGAPEDYAVLWHVAHSTAVRLVCDHDDEAGLLNG